MDNVELDLIGIMCSVAPGIPIAASNAAPLLNTRAMIVVMSGVEALFRAYSFGSRTACAAKEAFVNCEWDIFDPK